MPSNLPTFLTPARAARLFAPVPCAAAGVIHLRCGSVYGRSRLPSCIKADDAGLTLSRPIRLLIASVCMICLFWPADCSVSRTC